MPDRHPGPYRFRGNIPPSADVARPVAAYRHAPRADATGTAATLDILDVIDGAGGFWGIAARDVAAALNQIGDVDTLFVRLQSPGGQADEGVAIANLLRAHPATVRATVYGLAASAASYIAAAADRVSMAPGSRLFLHDALMLTIGNADDLRKDIENLDSMSDSIAALYAMKAGGTAEEWRAVMRDEKWYTADQAVEAGLADAVGIDQASGPVASPTGDEPAPLDSAFDQVAARFDLSMLPAARAINQQDPESSTDPEEDGSMPDTIPTAGVCRALNLPSDADEDTILDALDKNVKAAAEKPPAPPAALAIPDGKILVDAVQWEDVKAQAVLGAKAHAAQLADERDKVIAKAVDDGKLSRNPERVAALKADWDADVELHGNADFTRQRIADMAVLYPVAKAAGYAGSDKSDNEGTKPFTDEEGDALAALAGLPQGVLR